MLHLKNSSANQQYGTSGPSLGKIVNKFILLSIATLISNTTFAQPQEVLAKQQILKLALSNQPATLDPNMAYDSKSFEILKSLFQPLVRFNNKYELIPAAAQSWDISEDRLTYTFHLRKDAVWSNGTPVTADDFVFAWQRLVDPHGGSQAGSYLGSIHVLNALAINEGKAPVDSLGVKAIDPYTFEVKLSQPTPYLLRALNFVALSPTPKTIVEKYGSNWTKPENLVNNGAFLLQSNKVNEEIILIKNPQYYNASKVILQEITYKIIDNPLIVYNAFQNGEYSIVDVPKTTYYKAINHPALVTSRAIQTFGLSLNASLPKFQDVKIRNAIANLIDNKIIVEKVMRGQAVANSWVPPHIDGGDYVKPQIHVNLNQDIKYKQAIEFLKAAGYSKQKPLTIELLYPSTQDPQIKDLYIAIQSMLNSNSSEIVKLTLNPIEWKVFLDNFYQAKYEMVRANWPADYNHITNFLQVYLSGNPVNYARINDPTYDAILATANKTTNQQQRQKKYAEADQYLTSVNYAVIPIYHPVDHYLIDPKLRGFTGISTGRYREDQYFVETSQDENKTK